MTNAKEHYDAIKGMLANKKRKWSEAERRALDFANTLIAQRAMDDMEPEVEVGDLNIGRTSG